MTFSQTLNLNVLFIPLSQMPNTQESQALEFWGDFYYWGNAAVSKVLQSLLSAKIRNVDLLKVWHNFLPNTIM